MRSIRIYMHSTCSQDPLEPIGNVISSLGHAERRCSAGPRTSAERDSADVSQRNTLETIVMAMLPSATRFAPSR